MNKKLFILLVCLLFLPSFSSSLSIGTFEQGKEMQITNYCSSGDCTYVNLTSIIYPNGSIFDVNIAMTNHNQLFSYNYTPTDLDVYYFTTCGNPGGESVCDQDEFTITKTGYVDVLPYIYINFILLLLLSGFLILVIILHSKIDFEQWNEKIISRYKDTNPVKVLFCGLLYCFMKDTFFIYYLIGWPILIVINDIMYTFNITAIYTLLSNMIDLYSIGIYIVGLLFIGMAYQFLKETWNSYENMKWGVEQ